MIFIKKCDKVRIIQWYIADRIYTEKSFKEIYDLKQLEEIVRTEKNIWDYVQDVISAFLPIQTILKDVWVASNLTPADAPKNP